ncbi:MAG TPA: hypothetical protein VHN59_07600 [Chitinophagaceae bacterium]|nr:hypothetical protein [Chitinophagaceae bacterium]
MKKWIATYILFVSCIIFSISGAANSGQQFSSCAGAKNPATQKARALHSKFFLKNKKAHEERPDEFCRSLISTHAQCFSQITLVIPEEYPAMFPGTITPRSVAVPGMVVHKGYLLHLFPSHYFW